jgi:hypothetical protein
LRSLCDRRHFGKARLKSTKSRRHRCRAGHSRLEADGNPFVVREHFSRGEFASEIVDRLDRLCVAEAGTEKMMPLACLLWKGFGE